MSSSLINDGKLFHEPIIWAFVAERHHVENSPDEARYVEGMVVTENATKIGMTPRPTSGSWATCIQNCRRIK